MKPPLSLVLSILTVTMCLSISTIEVANKRGFESSGNSDSTSSDAVGAIKGVPISLPTISAAEARLDRENISSETDSKWSGQARRKPFPRLRNGAAVRTFKPVKLEADTEPTAIDEQKSANGAGTLEIDSVGPETVLKNVDAQLLLPTIRGHSLILEQNHEIEMSGDAGVTAGHPQEQEADYVSPEESLFRCEQNVCDGTEEIKMSLNTAGGTTVPSGITMFLRCSVVTLPDEPTSVSWHMPTRMSAQRPEAELRNAATDDAEAGQNLVGHVESVGRRRVGDWLLTTSMLTVHNVTEADSGHYVCTARLAERCCHRNGSVVIRVYLPPTYAMDLTIVGVVCFVEFLVIVYFKTKKSPKCASDNSCPGSPATNGVATEYEPLNKASGTKDLEEI